MCPYHLSGKKYPIAKNTIKNGIPTAIPNRAKYNQEVIAVNISFIIDILQFNTFYTIGCCNTTTLGVTYANE